MSSYTNTYNSNIIALNNYITVKGGLSNNAYCKDITNANNYNIFKYINCGANASNNPSISDLYTNYNNLVSNLSNNNQFMEDDIMPLLILNDFSISNGDNNNFNTLSSLLLNTCSPNSITTVLGDDITKISSYNCTNPNLTNYNTILQNDCNVIPDRKYNLYDFNYNIKFCDLYDINLNLIPKKVDDTTETSPYIFDMDLSNYLSQYSLIYLFLLDTLYFIYDSLNKGLITKKNIDNYDFTIPTNYKCVYNAETTNYTVFKINRDRNISKTINSSYTAKIPSTFTLKLNNINNCTLSKTSDATPNISKVEGNDITTNQMQNLLYFIRKSLDNHVKFIKNYDIIYADNFAIFFKTTKAMFLNTILSSINYMLYNDNTATTIATLTTNNSVSTSTDKDHSIALLDIISITDYTKYNNILKFNNNDNKCYTVSFITEKDTAPTMNTFDYTAPFTKSELTYFTTSGSYNSSKNTYEFLSSLNLKYFPNYSTLLLNKPFYYVYIPFYLKNPATDSNSVSYISKPSSYYFKYNDNIQINLSANSEISSITTINDSNFTVGSEYYIKLHNFTTIDSSANMITSVYIPVNLDFNIAAATIKWNNHNKVLYIKILSSTNTLNISSISIKIYGLTISGNKFTLPSTITGDSATYISFVNTSMTITDDTGGTSGTRITQSTSITAAANVVDYKIAIKNKLFITNTKTFNQAITNNTIMADSAIDIYWYNPIVVAAGGYKITPISLMAYNHTDNDSNINFIKFINNNLPIQLKLSIDQNKGIVPPCWFNIATTNTNATTIAAINNSNMDTIVKNISDYIEIKILNLDVQSKSIVNNMNSIYNLNNNITSSTTLIKKNYNNYLKENNKLISISSFEILAIFIFVISFILNIFILLVNNKEITLPLSIFVSTIIILIFIYLIISILNQKNKEKFTFDIPATGYNYNINNVEKFNNILSKINSLLAFEQYGIAQSLIQPRIKKELDLYTLKNKQYTSYNTISYNDTDVIKLVQKKKNAQLLFLINLSLVVSLCTLLFVLYPEYKNVLLGLFIVLILLILYIYNYQMMENVRTSSNKYYWVKPSDDSLKSLV